MTLGGASEERARRALAEARGSVSDALERLRGRS
jgi:NACalpha-BTF3-like transcription factor